MYLAKKWLDEKRLATLSPPTLLVNGCDRCVIRRLCLCESSPPPLIWIKLTSARLSLGIVFRQRNRQPRLLVTLVWICMTWKRGALPKGFGRILPIIPPQKKRFRCLMINHPDQTQSEAD